jgi:anti-sigma factor RsiW
MTVEHQRASELLPWYVNATLSRQEMVLVEAHLATCPECRQDLEICRGLSAAVRSTAAAEEKQWAATPVKVARVLNRLPRERGTRSREKGLLPDLFSWLPDTPRAARFALAAQALAVVALAAVLLLRAPSPAYETLSRPQSANAAQRARLHVVFAPEVTESALRQMLQGIGAVIVDGPSPAGVYTVELAFPASERERIAQIGQRLAADPDVRFAAPVAR